MDVEEQSDFRYMASITTHDVCRTSGIQHYETHFRCIVASVRLPGIDLCSRLNRSSENESLLNAQI